MKLDEITQPSFSWRPDAMGDVIAYDAGITTLAGAPKRVDGTFDCSHNKLGTLKYGPNFVKAHYGCRFCMLTDLKFAPKYVGGAFDCSNNFISDLHNIHKTINHVSYFDIGNNPIVSSILGLCLIDGIGFVNIDDDIVKGIFNTVLKHTKDKSQRLLLVQDQLIEAGYEKYAKL